MFDFLNDFFYHLYEQFKGIAENINNLNNHNLYYAGIILFIASFLMSNFLFEWRYLKEPEER